MYIDLFHLKVSVHREKIEVKQLEFIDTVMNEFGLKKKKFAVFIFTLKNYNDFDYNYNL